MRQFLRESIVAYFRREITSKIADIQITSVIRDFMNLIEQDKKENKQLRDAEHWEEQLTRYAKPETLSEFLADIFLYCIKQKNDYLKKPEFPFNNLMMRNEQFAGRGELIKTITDNFIKKKYHIQILSGMPGVGKTQLALEYAYKNASKYRIMWWINAESQTTLMESCGVFLQRQGATSLNYIAQEFCHFFERYDGQWLLIYDNAEFLTREQSELLSSYIPKKRDMGHILITTRDNTQFCGISPIHVDVFTSEDALLFIQKTVGAEKIDGAIDLAKRLGYLPLPLSYAVAYIDQTPACSCLEYLKLLSDKGIGLFDDSEDIQLDYYKWTVRKTFMISIGKFSEQAKKGDTFMKGVEQFIYSSAYLPAHNMDLLFIGATCEKISPEINAILKDDASRDRLVRTLTTCSLYYVANNPSIFNSICRSPVLGMHRLLQEVITSCISIPYREDSIVSHLPIVAVNANILVLCEGVGLVAVHGTANNSAASNIKERSTYNIAYYYLRDNVIPEAVEMSALFKLTRIIFKESIKLYYFAPCCNIPASDIAYTSQKRLYWHKIRGRGDEFNEENWLKSRRTKDELNEYLDLLDTIMSGFIHQYYYYWRIMVKIFIPLIGDMAGIRPFKNYSVDTIERIADIVTIMLIITDIPLYPDAEEFSQNWVYARIRAMIAESSVKYFDELLDYTEDFIKSSTGTSTTQRRAYYGASLEDMRERVGRIYEIFGALIRHTNDDKVDN